MPVRVFATPGDLYAVVGQEVAVGDWFRIDAARVREFAEATEDRQWIHLDSERAAQESPYGTTIAHGFMTLSLLPYLLEHAVRIDGVRLAVNYGLNRVRFPDTVAVGARIRGRFTLHALDASANSLHLTWHVTVERERGQKPCCVAEWLVRLYL